MSYRNLEQGIAAVQSGNYVEGARLINIALRSNELTGPVRATALLWLAETVPDREQKLAIYNQALVADPGNPHAQQRISLLLAQDLPPAPTAPVPPAPQPGPPGGFPGMSSQSQTQWPGQKTPPNQPAGFPGQAAPSFGAQAAPHHAHASTHQSTFNTVGFYRTVGVMNGPNGRGTAFFVSGDGLLATTRHVVGGEENLILELEPGQTINGRVVRSWPEVDLALISTGMTVNQLLSVNQSPVLPPKTPIAVLAHNRQTLNGIIRQTKSTIKPQWFPTNIDHYMDAGGNPILNEQNLLIGMLTHNANRTSPYVFGLHIQVIYQLVERFVQDVRLAGGGISYCPGCGSLSRAQAVGGYYCETCGNVLPFASGVRRTPLPQLANFYNETAHQPCPNCSARAGYYDGYCLRCGHEINTNQQNRHTGRR